MNRRTLRVVIVLGLLVAAAVAAAFDPAARIAGWVRGEPFYRGRSATAWRRDLAAAEASDRTRATAELADGGADAVPVLTTILRSARQPEARWRAADALGRIGGDARTAGPELVRALSDPDPHVQTAAAQALELLGPDVPGAVPALVAAFPRIEAIRAVTGYGPAAGEAVPALVELLRHADPAVRLNAARSLGKLHATTAVSDLTAALSDPHAGVREHAAEALGAIGPAAEAAVPALVTVLSDPNSRVRRDAVRALGEIGPAARPALPAVRACRADDDLAVRVAAERAERLIDPGRVAPDPP